MRRYGIRDLVLHYQPIVWIPTGETAMYECLARFINVDGIGIAPGDIAHLFDEPEFLWDVFEKTLPRIIQYAKEDISVSINVDVSSLSDRFFYFIEHFFHKHPDIAKSIHLEVTEKNIVKGLGALADHIEAIRKLGLKVVLDDFGTGGANIECLEKVRFDLVKIDGMFMKNSVLNLTCFERLQHIVKLLKSYDTQIVGEHIENIEIENVAKLLKIDFGQGHFYGMPKPSIGFEHYSESLYFA